jgi:hypothetical protein
MKNFTSANIHASLIIVLKVNGNKSKEEHRKIKEKSLAKGKIITF